MRYFKTAVLVACTIAALLTSLQIGMLAVAAFNEPSLPAHYGAIFLGVSIICGWITVGFLLAAYDNATVTHDAFGQKYYVAAQPRRPWRSL